jgi:hypothetical protein
MLTPFRCHWYESVPLPFALTVNVAGAPTLTVWRDGWVEIEGAKPAVYAIR